MRQDGSIDSAHCSCMAGLDECCSHVAAVLFTLESATKAKRETSVTDVPAYWMCPTGAKLDAPYKRIKEMDLQSAAKKRKKSITETEITTADSEQDLMDNIPSPTKNEEENFLNELNRCLPTSAILSLSDKFSENFVPKTQLNTWPVDLGKLYDIKNESLTFEDLLKECDKVDLSVTREQNDFLESQTRKQSSSPFWYKYRVGRVTASNFYSVCHTDQSKPSMTLIKKMCNSDEYSRIFTSAATEWGKQKEETARKDYVAKTSINHKDFKCKGSGLILNEAFPQFGASPDGLISCECCGDGCLEIKCPYSCKNCSGIEVSWLEYKDGTVKLKQKHPYYYQVQMSLYVTDRHYCDFFVWTPYASHLIRINKDINLWNEMSSKAKDFHRLCMMPELLGKFFTRQQVLKPILPASTSSAAVADLSDGDASDDMDSSRNTIYCVCGGQDDGRKMIMCESENCKRQWYHMGCIKLKRVPKGKWICKECRK